MPQGHLLAATEAIYAAATGELPWQEAGEALRLLLRAHSVSLMLQGRAEGHGEILSHARIPPEAVAAYIAHYRHVDLWTNRAAATFADALAHGIPPPVLASGDMLVPDAEFLRSEFYGDFGRRHGLRYVLGTIVPLGEAGLLPIGLHRPEGAARFGSYEKRLLEAVLPHLRRALQLRHRLAALLPGHASPSLAALDALALGVLVLDEDMHVLFANAAAEAAAQRPDAPLQLRRGNGTAAFAAATVALATHPQDRAASQRLVRETALAGAAGGAIRLADADGTRATAALVSPLPRRLAATPAMGFGTVPGRALVLLRPLSAPAAAPSASLLRDLFGLTRSEAEVACALAGGATKSRVASARGLCETTIRTHVRALLDKTGTANLRELERLLAGLAPP